MKTIKLFLYVLAGIALFLVSDLIYFYRNEPQKIGIVFNYFAFNEIRNNDLDSAIVNLNRTAELHIKRNRLEYQNKFEAVQIKNDLSAIKQKTKDEIISYLTKELPLVFAKNSAPAISNVFYNLALISYKNKYLSKAESLLTTAVLIDPEVGDLYIEQANFYFLLNKTEEGYNVLSRCQQFSWPKKQCQEYLATNVRTRIFLPFGSYKKSINELQKQYY